MRIRLFGRTYALAKPEAIRRPNLSEIGFFGTKIFAGIPMEEYNPALTGIESRAVYDQMRRSDGQVQAILLAMTLPIRSARWFLEPNEDGGREAQDIADLVDANLFGGMRYSWDDFLRESLLMLVFGFSVFEKVWTLNGGNVQIDKYAPRVAPSIWRWPQDDNYNVAEVEQINYVTGQMVRIPIEKCRVFTHWREGDNPEGISILRAAYKHWLIKDALLKIINIGVERSLIGVPVGTIPKGASDEDIQLMRGIVQNLRTDEQAGVTIPEGFLLDLLEGKRTPIQALPYVQYHDEQIARSVLAQWMGLGGRAQGGSQALSRDQTDMFLMCVEAEALYLQQEVQADIRELTSYNTDPRLAPKLKHKDIGYRDMSKFAQAMHELMGNKTPLLTIDDGLEDYVRDLFGLPEISPEQRQAAQAQSAATAGTPGPTDNGDPNPGVAAAPPVQPVVKPRRAPGGKPKEAFDDQRPSIRLAEGRRWRRDLTPYEHAVQLDAIEKQFDTAEAEMYARLASVVQKQGEGWLSRLETLLAGDDSAAAIIRAITSIDVKLQNQLSAVLRGYLLDLMRHAAKQAAEELGTTAPAALPPATVAAVQARSDAVAALVTQRLETRLQLVATRAVETGDSAARVAHAVRQEIATTAQRNPDLQMAATISVGQAINGGRDAAAMAAQNVQAAQWSAVLDRHTCPLCEELDGMVVDIHDPDYDEFQPPIHSGCRCVWAYIREDERGVERTWRRPSGQLTNRYANLLV